MEFKDKIKSLRLEHNYTQAELADKLGVSIRTYKNYELGETKPRYRKIYEKLAKLYDLDINYLLTEGDSFIMKANEEYGFRGKQGAIDLINGAKTLFAGGELSDADKQAVLLALQEAYFEAKVENKKYTRKDYINNQD